MTSFVAGGLKAAADSSADELGEADDAEASRSDTFLFTNIPIFGPRSSNVWFTGGSGGNCRLAIFSRTSASKKMGGSGGTSLVISYSAIPY